MPEINIWAVFAAAVATFFIGGLWYSPMLFARVWQREAGISDERLRNGNQGLIFGLAFGLSVVAAFVFAMFLGPQPGLVFATGAGFAAGLAWVAASLGIIYLFERRSLKLFLINGGYVTVAFTAIGAILGLWH
jgi:Protein of unknown function (DUF1761)